LVAANGEPGKTMPPTVWTIAIFRQCRGAVPAVERQGQRPPYAGIVERLPLVVGGDDQRAVPVALLYRDLVAERVPADGVVPLSPTFDTPDLLARSVCDLAYGFAALDPAGIDPDGFIARAGARDLAGVRIGGVAFSGRG
jgi:hypothetical protein